MGGQRQLLFGMYLDALDMNEVIERCHAALRGCLKKRWVISRGYDSFGFA